MIKYCPECGTPLTKNKDFINTEKSKKDVKKLNSDVESKPVSKLEKNQKNKWISIGGIIVFVILIVSVVYAYSSGMIQSGMYASTTKNSYNYQEPKDNISKLNAIVSGLNLCYINEGVTFYGSATGGKEPYTYSWDLDNDGNYDDGNGSTIFFLKSSVGTVLISFKVVDNSGDISTKSFNIIILEKEKKNETEENNEIDEYSWYFVRRFSGKDRTTTDTFHIQSDIKWRLDWKTQTIIPEYISGQGTSPVYPYFEFHVMKANTIDSVAYVRNESWGASNISEVYISGPQSYYLDVTARNIDTWTIDVYEWR